MLTVYFVRHGQSKDNMDRVHQGSKSPLSTRGKAQAQKVAKRLKKLNINHIYASPQKRAKETAIEISKEINRPIEYWGEIKEMPNPSELVGLHFRHPKAERIRKVIKRHQMKPNWKFSDEETFDETKKRARRVLRKLENGDPRETVLCVSHGSITKLLICMIIFGEKETTPEVFARFQDNVKTNNTGLTKCIYDNRHGWSLVQWNDSSHL